MNEFGLRILFAAVISGLGCWATSMWVKYHDVPIRPLSPDPIAKVVQADNEVMRRPSQHLIWKSINKNEDLYSGEAVRTAPNADAKIEFLKQGTTIQLDPDSMIEISGSDSNLNLDFLKGNLLIKSMGEKAAPALTLTAGGHKLSLKDSEVAVTKENASAPLEVQVFKGEVKEVSQGSAKPFEEPKIQIIEPAPNQTIYADPKTSSTHVAVRFKPVDPSYRVSLQLAGTPSKLKKTGAAVSGSAGEIDATLAPGRNYLRLVATGTAGAPHLESVILRTTVRARYAPEPLQPADRGHVHPAQNVIAFYWSNPGGLDDMIIEISRSPLMQPVLERVAKGKSLQYMWHSPAQPGPFYWRVSGRVPETEKMLSSSVRSFDVLNTQEGLGAPIALTPKDHANVEFLNAKENGVRLTWKSVVEASQYTVQLSDDTDEGKLNPRRLETKETFVRLNDLTPGRYTWTVSAQDDGGLSSPDSAAREFVLQGPPPLAWTDAVKSDKVIYRTEHPVLRASWQSGPGHPSAWRIRVTGGEREPASSDWKTVSRPAFEAVLDKPGVYHLEAESVDKSGTTMARTPERSITFEQAGPLPGPAFSPDLAKELKANDTGDLEISWVPVQDAQAYELQILTKSGNVVNSVRLKQTKKLLKGLAPGDYSVSVKSLDELGRLGPAGESRPLHVPEYSTLEAPVIKKVKIKTE